MINIYHKKNNLLILSLTTALPILATILWFTPILNSLFLKLDILIFKILNQSLLNSPIWQWFWGNLNHRREVWLNLVIATSINFWVILNAKKYNYKSSELIIKLIYFWLFYEVVLTLQDKFFIGYLNICRPSPSLVIEPWVKLSSCLNNPMIVDASLTSFPSGHAMAMTYWLCFTWTISPPKIRYLAIFTCIFFILPRLFSGAHWFSDSVFSALLAIAFFCWARYTALYKIPTKLIDLCH